MPDLWIRSALTSASLFLHGEDTVQSERLRSRLRFRRIALTGFSTLGARAAVVLTSLITTPLTYRYLGPERYGLWMTITSIIGAMAFADLGIGNSVVNTMAEAYGKSDRDLARKHLTSALVLLCCLAAVIGCVGVATYPFIPWTRVFNIASLPLAREGARAFLVLFVWFIANIPLGIVARVQSGFQESYWSHAIAVIGSIISLAALTMVVFHKGSLPTLVFASILGTVVAVFLNGWVLFRRRPWLIPRSEAFNFHSVRLICKLALMFFILQIAGSIGYASDNIIISQVLGPSSVSVYAVPHKLFSILSVVMMIGLGPMWPAYGEAIARGDLNWVRRTFWTSCRLLLATTVPICILLAMAGPWIIRVAMGRTLAVPHSVFIALGVWGTVSAASNAMAVLLNGASLLRSQAVIAIISGSINLALSILFTRRYGVIGVCLGSIIPQLLITIPGCMLLLKRFFAGMPAAGRPAGNATQSANLTSSIS